MKHIIGTIVAVIFFGLAILFLGFGHSQLTHSIIFWLHPHRFTEAGMIGINIKLGLGMVSAGLAALAWTWSDAWAS
jgi:hypothetical protein